VSIYPLSFGSKGNDCKKDEEQQGAYVKDLNNVLPDIPDIQEDYSGGRSCGGDLKVIPATQYPEYNPRQKTDEYIHFSPPFGYVKILPILEIDALQA
jgi:hypothetical protein